MEINNPGGQSGSNVYDCRFQAGNSVDRCILKIYHSGSEDYSEIGFTGTARKVILASKELREYHIGIPRVLGTYFSDDVACVAIERMEPATWDEGTRATAAVTLAQLHNISLSSLTSELQKLIVDSKTNRDRIRFGVIGQIKVLDRDYPGWRTEYPELSQRGVKMCECTEPLSPFVTLLHGDYFSKNLIPTSQGVYVIDWDLLSMGDPMWDLGFLLGTDNDVNRDEAEDVIKIYKQSRPIDSTVLSYHVECWKTFHALRKITKEFRDRNK
ncbi:MAG: aminoglycoside phosphotransferase family protein [Dehalococcoidales bacterium]|nr:aminoglycoside phosphotransferase family protein [Dehalococcoidales bacterium]